MTITPLPTPVPQRSAPALFSARMDALLSAMAVFVTEINALAVALNLSATSSVSATSLTIGIGTQTLTVEAAKSYRFNPRPRTGGDHRSLPRSRPT